MEMRLELLALLAAAAVGCGGDGIADEGGPDGGRDADEDVGGDAGSQDDGGGDGDGGDGDADADASGDADEVVPESCGFDYDEVFTTSLPPPAPFAAPAGAPIDPELPRAPGQVAHAEPAPPSFFHLGPKDPDDPDLVMPGYTDSMPLFERGAPWATARRCYETPTGVRLLTEAEAWALYRDVAELTTGVEMDATPGERTVVGIRGAYPGTFSWHGNAPDRFNDTLVLLWVDVDGEPRVREFAVNTDVGARDFGPESSSSLRPNRRYRYVDGWHRGYNALHIDEDGYAVRDDTNHNGHWDSDRNGWLPPRTADDHDRTGGGHNIHTGSVEPPLGSAEVGAWSAGCQVVPGMASWTAFITQAWTAEGDRVDYFLVDARDIAPEVWYGPCEPDGSHGCPFRVGALPYSHDFDTTLAPDGLFDVYSCSTADESGPEAVYLLTLDRSGTLEVAVDCVDPVDIDVHLLDGDDPLACLARDHWSFEAAVTPGRYFVVADSWADGAGDYAGPYTLRVSLR